MTDIQRMVKVYVKMRDTRTANKRAFEEADEILKAKMEKIEGQLHKFLLDNQIDSVNTPAGTVYRQEEITPTGSDWAAFYDWVKENDAFDALERRIKKTFVKEYMEQHDGGIPPGVSVYREYVVRIRRGK